MKTGTFILVNSSQLTPNVARMRFSGNTDAITVPGMFVTVSLPGFFLHRPFSVFDWGPGWLELLVERVGGGTSLLHEFASGHPLEIMTGLGNGFSLDDAGDRPLLVGGGTGLAPLLGLARRLSDSGTEPDVILGFRSAEDVFCIDLFESCARDLACYTEDGTAGIQGRVTDSEALHCCSKFYACGPDAMLRSLCKTSKSPGEVSLAVRMGCGFGACMGCSVKTVTGMKRVCKEGPVFRKEELLWEG